MKLLGLMRSLFAKSFVAVIVVLLMGAGIASALTGEVFQSGSGYELDTTGTNTFDITTAAGTGGPLWLRSREAASGGVFINTANNVGIGTTNPAHKLDVLGGDVGWGSSAVSNLLHSDQGGGIELAGLNASANPVTGGMPYIDFHYGTGSAQDYNVRLMNAANNRLDITTNSGGTVLSVNSGNVGIGTVAPAAKLSIAPDGVDDGTNYGRGLQITRASANTGQHVSLIRNGQTGWSLGYVYNTNTFGLGTIQATDSNFTGSAIKFAIDASGNVGLGTTSPGAKLDVAGTVLVGNRVESKSGTLEVSGGGWGVDVLLDADGGSADAFRILDTGAERFRVDGNTGNVGVGTENPGYKLDVVGTAQFSQPVIVGTPTQGSHAVTKSYVDAAVTGSAAITLVNQKTGINTCPATSTSNYLSCPAGYTQTATIAGGCNIIGAYGEPWGSGGEQDVFYAEIYNTVCEK